MIYKALHNKLRIVQHEPLLKYGDTIRCDERVRKYVPTSDTRRGNLAKNLAKIFLKTHTRISNKSCKYVWFPVHHIQLAAVP